MKSILGVSLLILLMPSAYAAALPGDSADGKRLHDANCMACHDTGIYTRKNRIVQSSDALKKRLGDCSHMANKEFSTTETQNIIRFSIPLGVTIQPVAITFRACNSFGRRAANVHSARDPNWAPATKSILSKC